MSLFSRKSPAPSAAGAGPTTAVLDFDPATAAAADVTGDYTVDPTHTRVGFSTRHAMVTTVRGSFSEFEGTAHLDVADPAKSWTKLRIQVASINTGDRKSTRLNSSHANISYAVFCLKKKNKHTEYLKITHY